MSAVPEERLDRPEIRAALEEVARERVPERVREGAAHPEPAGAGPDDPPEPLTAEWPALGVHEEHAGIRPSD